MRAASNNGTRKLHYREVTTATYHALSDAVLPEGEWIHIVVAATADTSITAYINGEAQTTNSDMTDTEIIIDPYSNIDLDFTAVSPDSESSQLSFNIKPKYHTYDSKSYNFSIFRDQILGDINGDNGLNVLDVVILVNMILGGIEETSSADVNQDGIINVLDVVTLINLILQ